MVPPHQEKNQYGTLSRHAAANAWSMSGDDDDDKSESKHEDDRRLGDARIGACSAVRQPETLLAMCCRAVEASGCGTQGEIALGGRERWHDARIEALGPFVRMWPRLARPGAWDLAWYRPEAVDLVDQVRATYRAHPRLFPARNTSTMGAWVYAHADGRPAPRLADAGRARVETLLRAECQAGTTFGCNDRGHCPTHVCSLSLPERLVLDDAVARLVARRGGPRPAPDARGLVDGLRFVSQPRPLLACVPRLLADALRWPPGRCALPVVPAYPFDHVVIAEWERDGMHGLVCVNANPAAADDYGHVNLVYLGADTFYAPCAMPLEQIVRFFVADRQSPHVDPTATDDRHSLEKSGDFFSWAMRQCADGVLDRLRP